MANEAEGLSVDFRNDCDNKWVLSFAECVATGAENEVTAIRLLFWYYLTNTAVSKALD